MPDVLGTTEANLLLLYSGGPRDGNRSGGREDDIEQTARAVSRLRVSTSLCLGCFI